MQNRRAFLEVLGCQGSEFDGASGISAPGIGEERGSMQKPNDVHGLVRLEKREHPCPKPNGVHGLVRLGKREHPCPKPNDGKGELENAVRGVHNRQTHNSNPSTLDPNHPWLQACVFLCNTHYISIQTLLLLLQQYKSETRFAREGCNLVLMFI